MKKLTALLLALVMVLALAACGGNNDGNKNNTPSEPAKTDAPAEPAKTDEPAAPAEPTVEPITLRIGYMPNYASLWGVLSAIEQGCFAEEGITIELTEFGDGPSEIAAMEGGSIDLAYIGKGAHRLCITGSATIFAPSSVHTVDKVVCMPDSGIKTVEDLKGKTIAYNAGSSSESTFNNALTVGGLTTDDVTAMSLSIDNIVPAAVSGSIDAAVCWNPYSGQILQQVEGSYEIEFADGSTNISSWICLPDYAAANHDILVRFSRALYKGMDWGSQEANYDTVAQYCADRTKTSLESNQLQVGDAHWFNIADLKAGLADGTIKGYYEGMQNDMVQGGNIEASDAKDDVGAFVLFDVMEEALK
ncbi:MAG: ABC transporter substrate-binding protein [Oscillibacter sp.]|nr:ABC transporter substrate-binding protein [Oscillibacter sp.]